MLSLDSCRAMALRNNKQLSVSRLKQEVATNTRKAVRTKYLPKVDAIGGYELLSKEISLLNNQQKSSLDNIGTTVVTNASAKLPEAITNMAQQGETQHCLTVVLGPDPTSPPKPTSSE